METDVLIIGAGAAGLMCAATAGARGRSVMVIDHAAKIGEKIRISGGGRCNFTNVNTAPDKFLSANPNFCRSALKRYTPHDFIKLIEKHGIAYHEKTLGQLFCDDSAQAIVKMLLDECANADVTIKTGAAVKSIAKKDNVFLVETDIGVIQAASLVIATGGLSIPKIGASGFGYDVARQFGLHVIETRASLVPLTFTDDTLEMTKALSGVAIEQITARAEQGPVFREAMLLTHRGLSGPAILQISSYWSAGEDIVINLSPDQPVLPWLKREQHQHGKQNIGTVLGQIAPRRLVQALFDEASLEQRLGDLGARALEDVADAIENWRLRPAGSEGYRTAEVTGGGVDTRAISSKTFEAQDVQGLYFIGEVLDVTGHLGGYNFQWAWSSGWCAGQFV